MKFLKKHKILAAKFQQDQAENIKSKASYLISYLGLTLIGLTLGLAAYAGSISDIPGLVPLKPGQRPATDLIYEGKILLPEEAQALAKNSSIDLSQLDPDATTDLWGNPSAESLKPLNVFSGDTVQFDSPVVSRLRRFRFTANRVTPTEGLQSFTFVVGTQAHNILLRMALLKKIGFRVPIIKHLKILKVNFSSAAGKELFIDRLGHDAMASPDRWILETDSLGNSPGPKDLILQDVIAFGDHDHFYNLAMGFVPAKVIQGRRLLNSMIVPWGLVHVPESVNLFSWSAGRIISNHLKFDFPAADQFRGNYEDARWIMGKIAALSRQDFEEIVESAIYPKEIEKLMVEKLISRRNLLAKKLNINSKPISFDSEITILPNLKNGKLLKLEWEGYASRFAIGDPESPLSNSEMLAFAQSKGLSNIIVNVINQLNTSILPHTDIQSKLIDHQIEQAKNQFADFLKTGKVGKTPLGAFAFPMFGTKLIASRDIVVGSYLGTDNKVQLADAVGFNINTGAYVGVEGLSPGWTASATGMGSYTRTFTHIRPVKSIKKASKYKFKNILVPLLKLDYAHLFDDLVAEGIKSISEEERTKRITKVFNAFKETMEIGESILVTDSLGGELKMRAGYALTDIFKAYGEFSAGQLVVSRTHILRKDENTIHVYKDLGNAGKLMIAVGLKAFIPIIRLSGSLTKGSAKTKFYSLNINEDENDDILKIAGALRALFLRNSTERLSSLQKPYELKYNFKETNGKQKLLLWQWAQLKSNVRIKIKHPEGAEKSFFRMVSATRKGENFEALGIDVINAIIEETTEEDLFASSAGNGLPGDTIYGNQLVRAMIFDAELLSENLEKITIKDPYLSLSYTWRGWSLNHKKLSKILHEINHKHRFNFYPDTRIKDTEKLLLYRIQLDYQVYEEAIQNLLSLNEAEVKKIFQTQIIEKISYGSKRRKLGKFWKTVEISKNEYVRQLVKRYLSLQKEHEMAKLEGSLTKLTSYVAKLVSLIETSLNTTGLEMAFGGKNKFHITSRIEGFKEGDENGDTTFYTDSIGEFGSELLAGPVNGVRDFLGMTESEFLIYWLMGRF